MGDESIGMVQECVDTYTSLQRPDGGLEIRIVVSRRFADLWLMKLSDFRATRAEIEAIQSDG